MQNFVQSPKCYNLRVFLYFSDWTTPQNLQQLKDKGFPHSGTLIKVFANNENPSTRLGRQITVVETSGNTFEKDELFKYPGRGFWLGSDLEVYLDHFHLSDEAKQETRALFRFAQSPEMEITQFAMSSTKDASGKYHYRHPLAIIDGLNEAMEKGRYNGLHLDIFTQRSIDRLTKIINMENTEGLVTIRESVKLSKTTPEGSPPGKETN